jgi:hypothetical protein
LIALFMSTGFHGKAWRQTLSETSAANVEGRIGSKNTLPLLQIKFGGL